MSKREIAKRYILFIASLFFSGLGVAITKRGELGVSPISSVANVLSLRWEILSLGMWLLIWNGILLIGQIVILRKDFQWIQLLQLPLSILFGWFTDLGLKLVSFVPNDLYAVRIACVVIGTVVLGFGVSLAVIANVIMNSGEAFVKAIADKTGFVFGNVKIAFDVSCVILALILSALLFHFQIKGMREGTVIAAFTVGFVVKFFQKQLNEPLNKLLSK